MSDEKKPFYYKQSSRAGNWFAENGVAENALQVGALLRMADSCEEMVRLQKSQAELYRERFRYERLYKDKLKECRELKALLRENGIEA